MTLTILFYLLLIFGFSLLLIKATDIIIINLKSLSQKTQLGRFAITTSLLALATSLPELVVCLTAALEKEPNLALGNVMGANIANLSLVIGGAALVGGAVVVRGIFLHRDVFYTFLAGAAPMVLLFDKSLDRRDGLILLALYGFYNLAVMRERNKKLAEVKEKGEGDFIRRLIRQLNHQGTKKELGWLFLGVALVLFSADMIVNLAGKMAVALNLPLLLIGLFIVSIGTTLPELTFSLEAIKEHEPSMVFGNLLGSVVANGTLIIGLVALINPFRIQAFDKYLLATITFVAIFGIFYLFIRTKHRLERWEGAALFGVYLIFALLEFLKA